MEHVLDPSSVDSYRMFCRIKQLPQHHIRGRLATFPDEYAARVGVAVESTQATAYEPPSWMFDYQADITRMAIAKRRFAVFADCGLGKTPIIFEFARHALASMRSRGVLITSPLNVISQTLAECRRFYGDTLNIEQVAAADLQSWLLSCGGRIGITNYESLRPGLRPGELGGLIPDESSMLKSHYGKWGQVLLSLGRGLEWKLCCTGTPAPNDRIEYANHAVFLGAFRTVNAFLATYFVNRGQSDNRWELKPHALRPFYRALSHWSIFLSNPAVYGWKDNTDTIPPIHVHIQHVSMTSEQRTIFTKATGELFANRMGGITHRSKLGQLGKGSYKGKYVASHKPAFIADLVRSWPDESTIVWCLYNPEQALLERAIPEAGSITGSTPLSERMATIDAFKAGRLRVLISKPKILGFGLNLQVATRQVFSGLQDSYESYYQAVKRSNRYGSTRPLNVHIPVTDIEEPMVQNVLRKARMVQSDTEEQERIFLEHGLLGNRPGMQAT